MSKTELTTRGTERRSTVDQRGLSNIQCNRHSGTSSRRGNGTDRAMHSGKQRGTYSETGKRIGCRDRQTR